MFPSPPAFSFSSSSFFFILGSARGKITSRLTGNRDGRERENGNLVFVLHSTLLYGTLHRKRTPATEKRIFIFLDWLVGKMWRVRGTEIQCFPGNNKGPISFPRSRRQLSSSPHGLPIGNTLDIIFLDYHPERQTRRQWEILYPC